MIVAFLSEFRPLYEEQTVKTNITTASVVSLLTRPTMTLAVKSFVVALTILFFPASGIVCQGYDFGIAENMLLANWIFVTQREILCHFPH